MTGGATRRGALFLLPEVLDRQRRPVAGMINAGHLARAAERLLGGGRVSVSARSGWWDGERAIREGSRPAPAAAAPARPRPPLPGWLRQTLKDARRIAWNLAPRPAPDGPPPLVVWQRLDPFFATGPRLAARHGVPAVVAVHALTVVERRKWGTGRLPLDPLLTWGERRVLARADAIAVVSAALVPELAAAGVRAGDPRLLVTPNQVDVETFRPRREAGLARRRELGIADDELVLGWAGSFRAFHRLDLVLEVDRRLAARGTVPRRRYLLVGDGAERPRVEAACAAAGVPAVFPGAVEHARLSEWLSAMDVGLVLGSAEGGAYHYSPVKLRELLACGVPVVASAVGEVAALLAATPFAPYLGEDAEALAAAVEALAGDAAARAALGRAARELALSEEGWEGQLRRVLERVGVAFPGR